MTHKILTVLLAMLFFKPQAYSQSYSAQRNEVLFVNVISNALIGGIGGAIHKAKDEKLYTAFIRNFLKGSIGGLVKYTAKYQLYYLGDENNAFYAPFNRLYYFLGHSMVMNAAYNKKLLDKYICNFDGVEIRVDLKEEKKIKARLSLSTVGSALVFAAKGFELDFFRSLEYGQLLFEVPTSANLADNYDGQAMFNCVGIRNINGHFNTAILPHEIAHTYQMYDFFSVTSFYDKKFKPKYESSKLYKRLSPYVVTDYESLFMFPVYIAQFHPQPNYYKNYFEFEAEHFSTRSYLLR